MQPQMTGPSNNGFMQPQMGSSSGGGYNGNRNNNPFSLMNSSPLALNGNNPVSSSNGMGNNNNQGSPISRFHTNANTSAGLGMPGYGYSTGSNPVQMNPGTANQAGQIRPGNNQNYQQQNNNPFLRVD
jgi:hypothetical protein